MSLPMSGGNEGAARPSAAKYDARSTAATVENLVIMRVPS
jgi:hypothetical protein